MITQNELRSLLRYDVDTGRFAWAICVGRRFKSGDQAGSKHRHGYIVIRIRRKPYMAHRLAWLYVHGTWPIEIDHINGERDDNRLCNLRNCTRRQNEWNKTLPVGKAKLRGVRMLNGKWLATIKINGKNTHLGTFQTPEAARLAYCQAAAREFGEFAGHLNRDNTS